MGRIKFNTAAGLDGVTLTNRLFSATTMSIIHNMIHILGFDRNLYSSYIDPTTGSAYTTVISTVSTNYVTRPTTYMIVTPNVVT
jgi:hypothetical protein